MKISLIPVQHFGREHAAHIFVTNNSVTAYLDEQGELWEYDWTNQTYSKSNYKVRAFINLFDPDNDNYYSGNALYLLLKEAKIDNIRKLPDIGLDIYLIDQQENTLNFFDHIERISKKRRTSIIDNITEAFEIIEQKLEKDLSTHTVEVDGYDIFATDNKQQNLSFKFEMLNNNSGKPDTIIEHTSESEKSDKIEEKMEVLITPKKPKEIKREVIEEDELELIRRAVLSSWEVFKEESKEDHWKRNYSHREMATFLIAAHSVFTNKEHHRKRGGETGFTGLGIQIIHEMMRIEPKLKTRNYDELRIFGQELSAIMQEEVGKLGLLMTPPSPEFGIRSHHQLKRLGLQGIGEIIDNLK